MNKFKWKFQKKLNRESSEQLLSLLGSFAVPGSSTQGSSHELQENIIRETEESPATAKSASVAGVGIFRSWRTTSIW